MGSTAGKIIASWASVNMSAPAGVVGGLVCRLQDGSRLTASYALGDVTTRDSRAGGLVGRVEEDARVDDSYFNTETLTSLLSYGRTYGRTTAELQSPTGYAGIYANWNVDVDNADGDNDPLTGGDNPWDFGTSGQYPRLKADRNRDGVYTAAEFGRLAGLAAVNPSVTRGGDAQFLVTVEPAPTADLDVNLSVVAYGQTAATRTVTVPAGRTTAVLVVPTTSSTPVGALRATVAGGPRATPRWAAPWCT